MALGPCRLKFPGLEAAALSSPNLYRKEWKCMLALHIPDVRDFTSKLFLGDVFDAFYCCEASFTTYFTCTIDGNLKKEFFDSQEAPKDRDLCLWEEIKPYCRTLIRGRHTPLHFQIVFQLSHKNVEKLLQLSGLSLSPENISGLYLNCRFDRGSLICTTGTALRIFTMDKSLDQAWDSMVTRFFRQKEIPFQEV